MLPHTAKWENYNGEKQTEGKKESRGEGLQKRMEIKRQKERQHEVE